METLKLLNAEFNAQLTLIRSMELSQWLSLASSLGVEKNDREHAAKKLAIRSLRSKGLL
jgi:hypothetical protein